MKILKLLTSSIGLKIQMAISGVAMIGFLIGHLLGNLQIFIGQEKFNDYAEFLHSMPNVLWIARSVLIAALIIHVYTAIKLGAMNKKARGTSYRCEKTVQASFASRYMFHSGMIILIFIFIHLAHFTFKSFNPEYSDLLDEFERPDVYRMLILGFKDIPMSIFYIVANIFIGIHLHHAVQSFFRTLGLINSKFEPLIKSLSALTSILLSIGFISIPLTVLLGVLK